MNTMKKVFMILCLLTIAISNYASKVYPFPVTVTQKDGTQLTIIGHGDVDCHWFTTLDGVLLYQDGIDYYVARVESNGELASTNILAHNADKRSQAEHIAANAQNKELFMSGVAKTKKKNAMRREPVSGTRLFPHTGTPRVLVVLAEFSDTTFSLPNPKKSFNQYLNSSSRSHEDYGNSEHRNMGSVKQYFTDVSFGNFSPQFDIYGPVKLPKGMATYGAGRNDRMDLFIPAVCNAINDSVNFADYDQNGDGYVDLIYVIYAGYGANTGGNSESCIWPKSGGTSFSGTYDGKSIYRYGVNCELIGNPTAFSEPPYKRINSIGIFCHEFSHCLGLPDFYPAHNTNAQTDNQGMEYWSLMDNGEYLRNGYYPPAYTAWEREAMGWFTIDTLQSSADIEMIPIDAGGKAYRIMNDNDASGKEYFILENIQYYQWNGGHFGKGLVVNHVSYDSNAFSLTSNSVNDVVGKPKMTIVPADGILGSSYKIGKTASWATAADGKATQADYNSQHAGDPFPGTTNATELNDTLNFTNFKVYKGTKINKALANIQENSGVISFKYIHDFDDHVTGINSITNQTTVSDGRIYTIDGRFVGTKLENLPKGIYIQNKKKVIVP